MGGSSVRAAGIILFVPAALSVQSGALLAKVDDEAADAVTDLLRIVWPQPEPCGTDASAVGRDQAMVAVNLLCR
jgi:hypothetical protein